MSNQSDIKEGLIQITKSRPMTYQLLRFLVENNCVIKVEGMLPSKITCINTEDYVKGFMSGLKTLEDEMVKAGYAAVENLIDD